jgi:hypothetical protein
MTAYALSLAASHSIVLSIIVMGVEGALIHAYLTLDAALGISLHDKPWWQICLHFIPRYLLTGIPLSAR